MGNQKDGEKQIRPEPARRKALKAGLGAALGTALGAAALSDTANAATKAVKARPRRRRRRRHTYVLVHGAWHGGWCWRWVADRLRLYGHRVSTPTLSGLGERAHLRTADTNLDTHVQDIVAHIVMEDLRNVVLVGHSYSGMVIAGVLARVPGRIKSMVYLDAFFPVNGEAVISGSSKKRQEMFHKLAEEGKTLRPTPVKFFGVKDEKMQKFADKRMTPQPVKTFTQPVKTLRHRPTRRVKHTYILAKKYKRTGFTSRALIRVKRDRRVRYREIDTGHDAMLVAPNTLAAMLMRAA